MAANIWHSYNMDIVLYVTNNLNFHSDVQKQNFWMSISTVGLFWIRTEFYAALLPIISSYLLLYYYTCIYNAHTFSSDTESEVLAVTRWAAC